MTFPLSFSHRQTLLAGACAILAAAAVPARAAGSITHAGDQYIETQVPSCATANFCEFKFSTVPDGKTLLVTRVTCGLKFNSPDAKLYNSFLGQKIGLTRAPFSFLVPVITATFATTRYMEINSEVFHPYTEAQTPQIFLRVADAKFIDVTCSIAGLLTVPRLP